MLPDPSAFTHGVADAFARIGNDKAEAEKKESAAVEAMHKLAPEKRVLQKESKTPLTFWAGTNEKMGALTLE